MTAWFLPLLAAVFGAGLLARPALAGAEPAWTWTVPGLVALAAAAWLAPRSEGERPLEAAGLVRPDAAERLVASVAPPVVGPAGRALAAAVVAALGAFALAVGWGSAHEHRVRDALVARLAPAAVQVEGSLRTDPNIERDRWSAVLDVREVAWAEGAAAVREAVRLSGRGEPPAAVRGDRLVVRGTLRIPDGLGFATFLLRRGLAAELRVDTAERVGPAAFAPVRWAQSVRAKLTRSIVDSFPPREAGLLLGLAVGDDTRLDPVLERDFRASGLSHLLVVSGGNVAMVLAPVLALAGALRLARGPRFAIGVATVAFFVLLTGAEPSVLRAGLMAAIALAGVLLGRPRSSASALAGAALVLLVLDPALAWSVGFQLSVAATAAMVALATPIAERLPLPRPVALAAGATFAAQVGVTPLLLFWFHEVPLSTLLANVLAFPAVAPALLLGLGAAGAGLVAEPLGRPLAALGILPMRYLEAVADRLGRAPVPWLTGGGAATLAGGVLAALALAWWLRSGRRLPRAGVVALLALAPIVAWSGATGAGPPDALTVRFIDVEQGDAALLTSPAGAAILVDGGPDPSLVATELVSLGIRRLDVVVATHPHADHLAGLPAVLARLPVGLLLEPGCPHNSPDLADVLGAARAEKIPTRAPRAGEVLVVGDVRLEVLAPTACWHGTDSDANNDSIVIRASVGDDTVLFTGDVEIPAQEALVEAGASLDADVLKVPHHGGATSLPAFFEAVGAELAVVSVGRPNPYGHPAPEVLAWLGAAGSRTVRTDVSGDVTVTFAGGRPVVASAV